MQSDYYNSVVVSDSEGRLINYSPNILNIDKNKVQTTLGISNSIKEKKHIYHRHIFLLKRI